MDDVDEIIEKIKAIQKDVSDEKPYHYLEKKYGVTAREVLDIKFLSDDELKDMRSSIKYIKEQKDKNVSTRRISANLGMGTWTAIYILKQLGYDTQERNKRTDNSITELEGMWRAYKSGETIKNIAALFGHSYEDTEALIAGFDKRIEKRRKNYDTRRGKFEEEEERKKLQKYLRVSAELIDYMLKGTPIIYAAKGHRNSNGNENHLEGDER